MKNKTLKALKLVPYAIFMAVRIEALDVACFVEKTRRKGGFSKKWYKMRMRQFMLCEQGKKVCDEALAILHNQTKEEL